MNRIIISALQEVVVCSKCQRQSVNVYLSEFSYGQRLYPYDNGKQYAFINLLESELFDEYDDMLTTVIKRNGIAISRDKLNEVLNQTFGITFDKIDGQEIDYSGSKKCCEYCSSFDFESLIAEPEKLVDIEATLITHEKWMSLTNDEKKEKIEEELKRIG